MSDRDRINESVHLRNARALAEGARVERVRLEELQDRVRHLENQLAMVRVELTELRQQFATVLAMRGRGPTSR